MSEKNQSVEELIRQIEAQAAELSGNTDSSETSGYDRLMVDAIECVIKAGVASTAIIQKGIKVGYARAGRMIDDMEQLGIVGPHQGVTPRKVLITKAEWETKRAELFPDVTTPSVADTDSETMDADGDLPLTYIKDLPYSDSLKSKLYKYVEQVKAQDFKYCNCALIGCPIMDAYIIIPAIASELNVKQNIEISFYADFIKDRIAELPDRSIFCFCKFKTIKPDAAQGLNKAMLYNKLTITRSGSSGKTEEISLPEWLYIVCVDKKSDIPVEIKEGLYKEVDLTENALDFRIQLVRQALDKHGLTVEDENLLWEIAKACPQNDMIMQRVIEIRNRAFEDGTTIISEKHLSDSYGKVEGLEAVDSMEGREFEIFTGNLLRGNGFTNIQITPSSGDFGADVIAEKDGVKYAIQCKRYSSPVGVSAVQEVIASKSLHDCHVACVLTNSTYTPAAVELAKKNLVILWDRAKLKEFIDRASSNG